MNVKKIISISLILILTAAMGTVALAGPVDDVEDALKALVNDYPGNKQLADSVNEALEWLKIPANAAVITPAGAATVTSEIAAARSTIGAASRMADLDSTQVNSVIKNITNAANAVGLTVQISSDLSKITIYDSNNVPITSADTGWSSSGGGGGGGNTVNPIKQTGISPNLLGFVAVGLLLTAILMISIYVILLAKKKEQKQKEQNNKQK